MTRKRVRRARKTEAEKTRASKTKDVVSLVSSLLIGLTLLASGTGKILGMEEVPAQVVDFISNIIPDIFITPAAISFLYNIFIPYVLPWAEFVLAICLLTGFLPRLIAILTIPLLLAFLGTNLWAISRGGYATCASCFGIWERYLGSLTPAQSLIYDLVLLALAIVIIIVHPEGFLSSRRWLKNLVKEKGGFDATSVKLKMRLFAERSRSLVLKSAGLFRLAGKFTAEHTGIALLVGICLLCLIAYGITAAFMSTTMGKPIVSGVSVSDLSETSAVISWKTDKPTTSSIEIYTADHSFTVTDEDRGTSHRLLVTGLTPNTTYQFSILDHKKVLSKGYSFKTLAPTPLSISNVTVTFITDSSATITWGTTRPATSEVQYWVSGFKERYAVSSSELTINHSINVTSLEADAIYHFVVKSTDASGNQAISPELAMSSRIGKEASDFTLSSLDGKPVKLSDYRGKVVMLDFWLWTCSACRKKLSIVQETIARMPSEKVVVLAIHFEGKESVIQSYALSEGLTIPILLDLDGAVSDVYKVYAFPTTFFIDRDGIIRLIDPEFSNAEELENILSTLLKSK